MNESRISTRYAQALLLTLADSPKAAEVYAQARGMLAVMQAGHAEIQRVLSSAVVDDASKGRFLTNLVQRFAPELLALAKLMLQKGRGLYFERTLYMFLALYRRKNGIVSATVRSVVPLNEAQQQSVERFLAARYSGYVELEAELAPELIGGFQLEVDGGIYDRSVRGELTRMATSLAR